jgi:hypothetical protein
MICIVRRLVVRPGYVTTTRTQSNSQWSGGNASQTAQTIPSAKIRWKISRLEMLVSTQHSAHLLYSKGPHYPPINAQYLTVLALSVVYSYLQGI